MYIYKIILAILLTNNLFALAQTFNFNPQENLINSIILNQAEIKHCSPVIILPKDRPRPEFLERIFPLSPQHIFLEPRPRLNSHSALSLPQKYKFSKPCSIVLYFFEQNVRNLELLRNFRDDFIRNLPGGFFNTYHIIFGAVKPEAYISLSTERNQPVPELLLQMHNLLFVFEKEPSNFDLFTTDTLVKASIQLGNLRLNKTNNESKYARQPLFADRWKDYGGRPFVLATTPDTTQSQMDDYIRTKEFNTYAIVGSYEIFRYINATARIITMKSGIYGQKLKNGTWIGMIGEVLAGRADATTSIQIIPERVEAIDYTKIYFFTSVIFLSALSKKAGPSGNVEFLAHPFSPIVWLAILITFLSIYTALAIRFLSKPTGGPGKSYVDLLLILNITLRPIMDQPGDTPYLARRLRNDLTRFIFALWLIGLISLSCAYKSQLISALLTPTYESPPKTFSELADSNYGIGAVLYNESFVGESFRALHNKIGHEVRERVKPYDPRDPTCYRITQTKKEVCLGIRAFVEPIVYNFLTDENGQSLFRISTDTLFPTTAAMGLPKKFPHVKQLLDRVLGRVESLGLLNYWISQGSEVSRIKGQRLSKRVKIHANKARDTSGDQQIRHFVSILVFGLGISFAFFVSENTSKIFRIIKRKLSLK